MRRRLPLYVAAFSALVWVPDLPLSAAPLEPTSGGTADLVTARAPSSQWEDLDATVASAEAALDVSGNWTDSYGYKYALTQSGNGVSGSVATISCGGWPIKGKVTGASAFSFRATNPTPGNSCAAWFEYSMTMSSDVTATGSWRNAGGDAGSVTMTLTDARVVNFRQVGAAVPKANGTLHFDYAWDSSTGKLSDLGKCEVGEKVDYPGGGGSYTWPSPPWNGGGTPNPTILWVAASRGTAVDNHSTRGFLKPYKAAGFTAKQDYRVRCNSGTPMTLKGWSRIAIVRKVADSTGRGCFVYTIRKSGGTAALRLPNITPTRCRTSVSPSPETAPNDLAALELSALVPDVVVGGNELTRVTLAFRNRGTSMLALDLGKDGKSNLQITAKTPSGRAVVRRLPSGGFGASGAMSIEPNGVYQQSVLLNEWLSISQQGSYVLAIELLDENGKVVGPAARVRVTVGPRDPDTLNRQLRELAARALNGQTSAERLEAAADLGLSDDPLAAPYLAEVVRKGGSPAQNALRGLARSASPEAAAALSAAQNNPDRDVRAAARAFVKSRSDESGAAD